MSWPGTYSEDLKALTVLWAQRCLRARTQRKRGRPPCRLGPKGLGPRAASRRRGALHLSSFCWQEDGGSPTPYREYAPKPKALFRLHAGALTGRARPCLYAKRAAATEKRPALQNKPLAQPSTTPPPDAQVILKVHRAEQVLESMSFREYRIFSAMERTQPTGNLNCPNKVVKHIRRRMPSSDAEEGEPVQAHGAETRGAHGPRRDDAERVGMWPTAEEGGARGTGAGSHVGADKERSLASQPQTISVSEVCLDDRKRRLKGKKQQRSASDNKRPSGSRSATS